MNAVIVQPSYLPWIGFFGMIDIADVFIFYDDVQFVKQSWQQRNRIKSQNSQIWLTVPILRKFGQKINETKIDNSSNWFIKHWKSIYYSYNNAPYFDEYNTEISSIYDENWHYLCDLNIRIIEVLTELLKLDKPQFIKSSDIDGITGKKTDRLLNILGKMDIDGYISGPAAMDYIEPLQFKHNNINLYWFEYKHPVYPQIGDEFTPYMSVIDLLFNKGDKSRDYIKNGNENSLKLDPNF